MEPPREPAPWASPQEREAAPQKRPTRGEVYHVTHLETPKDETKRARAGKRSYSKTERKRGRYIQSRPAGDHPRDIAFDATLRAAAPYQKGRPKEGRALAIERHDIHEKIRVRRTSNLILFTVDASWSMSAVQRMKATTGAVMSLLTDAYQRRDQVGLVAFRGRKAYLVLPPTSSVERAKKALADVPVGGKTPLGAGLLLSHQVLSRCRQSHPELRPLMILLTDGAGNVSISDLSPDEEAHRAAERIRQDQIQSVVINMESSTLECGLAQRLADALGAPCYTVEDLKAEKLYQTVKAALG